MIEKYGQTLAIDYVDHMGADLSVVNAARVSFDKHSFSMTKRDESLLDYLADHKHWSPFAHTALTVRVTCPIFIARQVAKHQVGLVINEVSRRYVDNPPSFYEPDVWRQRAENVKQGSSNIPIDEDLSEEYRGACDACERFYRKALSKGNCPEQARMVLPQSMITEFYWTGNLAAFIRVCELRLDEHTQKETRDLIRPLFHILADIWPRSVQAYFGHKDVYALDKT